MKHEAPAAAVDADVVVELAQQHALAHGGFAAVFLVLQVVHVAPGGGPAAAGPGAAAVAELDGAADAGRDGVGVADVQRQRRRVVGWGQEGGAQPAGEAGRAGDEVDGQPGDGVPQRLGRVGGEPLPGPAAGAGRGPGRGGSAGRPGGAPGRVADAAATAAVPVGVAVAVRPVAQVRVRPAAVARAALIAVAPVAAVWAAAAVAVDVRARVVIVAVAGRAAVQGDPGRGQ